MIHIIGGGLAGSRSRLAGGLARRAASSCTRCGRCGRPPCTRPIGSRSWSAPTRFRGDKLDNAVGLLKEEMRRLGSLVMRAADAHRVPAGAALAVDRERFSQAITDAIAGASADHRRPRGGRRAFPTTRRCIPLIIATGPLTSDALSADIAALVGGEHLYFYDAISPIVLAETIDMTKVFRASRWGRSLRGSDRGDRVAATP